MEERYKIKHYPNGKHVVWDLIQEKMLKQFTKYRLKEAEIYLQLLIKNDKQSHEVEKL